MKNFTIRPVKKQSGFSLLEIILAISILAAIGMLTVNLLSGQLEMREKVTSKNRQLHTINMAVKRIYDDLQSAYISNPSYSMSLNLNNRSNTPQFSYRGANLILTVQNYNSFLANSSQSNFANVRYYLKKLSIGNGQDSDALMRVVDTDMVDNINNSDVGATQVLISDVREFNLEFWDGGTYQKEWDSTANDTIFKLPKLVKIHLSIFEELSARQKQMKELVASQANDEKRKFITIDTIVYLINTVGQTEVVPPSEEFKWQ